MQLGQLPQLSTVSSNSDLSSSYPASPCVGEAAKTPEGCVDNTTCSIPIGSPRTSTLAAPVPAGAMRDRMERIAGLINKVQSSVAKQDHLLQTTRMSLTSV